MGKKEGIGRLTPKMEKFIAEYVTCCNGAEAARRAGYEPENARVIASQNLSKLNIQQEIKRRRDALKEKFDVKQEDLVAELREIAFARPKEFAKWDTETVDLYPSDDLREGIDRAIKKVKKVCSEHGVNVELEFHGKIESIKLLAQMLGFLDGEDNTPDDPEIDLGIISAAMERIKR